MPQVQIYHSLVNPKTSTPTLLPPDCPLFNETNENIVKFVQGANAFIVLFEVFEILKLSYLHSVNSDQEFNTSWILLSMLGLNLTWILVAFYGIKSINSRQSNAVRRFFCLLGLNGLLRGLFYSYGINRLRGLCSEDNGYCSTIYQGNFYIIQGFLETFAIGVLFFLTKSIKDYLKGWKEFQDFEELCK